MEVLFCIYNKLMYNVGRQSAIDQLATCRQQAKKKPLVTEILPDPGYAWGWRCELDYDRFFSFGQIISVSIATTGNWRMAMAQSQAPYDPHTQPHNRFCSGSLAWQPTAVIAPCSPAVLIGYEPV